MGTVTGYALRPTNLGIDCYIKKGKKPKMVKHNKVNKITC
jgi:hypothetical protein